MHVVELVLVESVFENDHSLYALARAVEDDWLRLLLQAFDLLKQWVRSLREETSDDRLSRLLNIFIQLNADLKVVGLSLVTGVNTNVEEVVLVDPLLGLRSLSFTLADRLTASSVIIGYLLEVDGETVRFFKSKIHGFDHLGGVELGASSVSRTTRVRRVSHGGVDHTQFVSKDGCVGVLEFECRVAPLSLRFLRLLLLLIR